MMERVLCIGEAPNPNGDEGAPLEGALGRRIAEYAGLTWEEYLERTERRNLQPTPGAWSDTYAELMAQAIFPSLIGRRTILLGQRVARAFNVKYPVLKWATIAETRIAVVPHPSGLNRWWNEPENRAAARRFLEAAFAGSQRAPREEPFRGD